MRILNSLVATGWKNNSKFVPQCATVAYEAASNEQIAFWDVLKTLLAVRQRNEIILLYLPLEKPQSKYCIQFRALHLKTDVYQVEIEESSRNDQPRRQDRMN